MRKDDGLGVEDEDPEPEPLDDDMPKWIAPVAAVVGSLLAVLILWIGEWLVPWQCCLT